LPAENRSRSLRPAYLESIERGAFRARLEGALALIESCTLCPRNCRVDRPHDETGVCRIGRRAVVSSAHPHFGEERPLVGTRGSGTIFFSGCNLRCLFCQNYEISHFVSGHEVSSQELASLMLHVQEAGCHNLNLVTPTHVVPQILEALEIAASGGFALPLVYNTGGFDKVEVLRLLDGIVDIYMPDIKFLSGEAAERYTSAGDYPDVVRSAVKEMHRQVGDLTISSEGIAERGLLVRHLVMPGMLDDTRRVVEFIANEISPNTYVNVMRQYRPEYKACDFPPIGEPLTAEDWRAAVALAREAGITRLDEG